MATVLLQGADVIELIPAAYGSYQTIDVSAYVSADARGVILAGCSQSTSSLYSWDIRCKGSTDAIYIDTVGRSTLWMTIGIDGDKCFEAKLENNTFKIYLLGYVEDEVDMFVNGVSISLGTTGSYQDIDISAHTTEVAIAAILQIWSVAGTDNFKVRPNGSTTDPPLSGASLKSQGSFTIGVDEDEIFEGYIAHTDVKFLLNGYYKSGAVFNVNPTTIYAVAGAQWSSTEVISGYYSELWDDTNASGLYVWGTFGVQGIAFTDSAANSTDKVGARASGTNGAFLLYGLSNKHMIFAGTNTPFAVIHTLSPVESLSLSELSSKSPSKPINESLSLASLSSLNTSWSPSYIDNIILNDNADVVRILGDYPYPNDVIPLLDTIGKRVTKYIVDYVNVIDSFHGLNTKPLAVFDYFYLTDYNIKGIQKYVSDSFNLSEFLAILTSGHLRFFESALSLSDSVAKLFARPVRSWFELWQHLRLLKYNGLGEYWLYINEQERLSEVIEKIVYAPKGDVIGLIITVFTGNTLIFQDNIALTDEIVKTIGKNITEVIDITESPSTLFSEIVYFDNAEIYPEYIVTGIHFYGGAEMHVFPSQTCIVEWDIRDFETETLYDPDSHTVEIYDCRNSRRVAYDSSKLVKESTGHYKYAFTVPDTVVAGDWYARVKATKGTSSTVLHVHFEVKRR